MGPIDDSMLPNERDCIVVEFGKPIRPRVLAALVPPWPDAIKESTNAILVA